MNFSEFLNSSVGHFSTLIFSLLVIASIVGYLMRWRKKGEISKGLINYQQRVRSWWVMCIFLGACFALGWGTTIALFGICSFMALREFIILTPTKKSDYWALFLAFYVAVPIQYLFIYMDRYGLFSIFIPVWLFAAISAVQALSQDTHDFLARNAKIQFAVLTCVFGVSHAPALLMLKIPNFENSNFLLLLFFIFVVQLSDVAQYVFGKLFGKTPLVPKVSPNKTAEGLVGGGLTASLAGACLYQLTPFTFWEAFILSSLIVLGGFLGGLVMSAVKRSLGAKDWGNTISGHGGFMDRLDSVAFAAPLFFHAVRFFYT